MKRSKLPRQAITLRLTERQFQILTEEHHRRNVSKSLSQRLGIVLLSHHGKSNTSISQEIGVTVKIVRKWRNRFAAQLPAIQVFESGKDGKGISDTELRKYLLAQLKDAPRSGTPKKFTAAEEQQIIALACDEPATHGIAVTDWTHEKLAWAAAQKGIVSSISAAQVGRILKNQPTATAKI